jgi:hypothetical protein
MCGVEWKKQGRTQKYLIQDRYCSGWDSRHIHPKYSEILSGGLHKHLCYHYGNHSDECHGTFKKLYAHFPISLNVYAIQT